MVDNRQRWIKAFDPDDLRRERIKVAGPAALVVSKAHKLGERQAAPRRLENKDAHDLDRLLRATETAEIAAGFEVLLKDSRSAEVTVEALEYLDQLFDSASSLGSRMAGEAEKRPGEPEVVAASVTVLVADLRKAVRR